MIALWKKQIPIEAISAKSELNIGSQNSEKTSLCLKGGSRQATASLRRREASGAAPSRRKAFGAAPSRREASGAAPNRREAPGAAKNRRPASGRAAAPPSKAIYFTHFTRPLTAGVS